MRSKALALFITIIIGFTLFPTVSAEVEDDFRTIDFDDKGYLIRYEIVQGDNLENVFADLGFNIKGTIANAELHVLLKDRREVFREVYLIESDKFVIMPVTLFTIETYVILNEPIEVEVDPTNEIILDLIGYNFQPVDDDKISATLPSGTSIVVPKIFTNITRPNFGGILTNSDIFDFLPIILDNDYTRFEAEFATLVLDQSFSVNVFNQGYDDFTVSLEANLEPAISIKASWNKQSGLLKSFSSHMTFGDESTTLIFSFLDYEEINSPIDTPIIGFFINNSYANYELYQYDSSTEDRLSEWAQWFNLLNQTVGIQYNIFESGLDFDWSMRVFDVISGHYDMNTPIHSSWSALMPPALLPLWARFEGTITLIQALSNQLENRLNGYQFYLKGVTDTLYTIEKFNFDIEYYNIDNVHNIIWDLTVKYQGNNTQTVIPRIFVEELNANTTGWLAYSNEGILKGFSHFYQEHIHTYYDPEEPTKGDNYFYEYLLESNNLNLTVPSFPTEITDTSFSNMVQIVFYVLLVYFIWRKRRNRSAFN